MNEKNEFLTTKEAAEKLGVKQVTVRFYCEKGLFAGAYKEQSRRGETWLIPAKDLDNFVKPQRGQPKKEIVTAAGAAKRRQREREQQNTNEE